MNTHNHLIVEVTRGSTVESIHEIQAVVADTGGRILDVFGAPEMPVFPRSSIKALQALDFMGSGAFEKFHLDDRMIAMASSSHKAEEIHLKVIREWLSHIHQDENILECGHAWPSDEKSKEKMIREGHKPKRICHNCSGKHLGMISSSLARGESPNGYRLWQHPVQARIRSISSELMKIDLEKAPYGIDGCGIPTYAIPLQNLAIGGASFLKASVNPQTAEAKIFSAMAAHPDLVAGSGDFVTLLMEKTKGRCLVKTGAEGVCLGWVPSQGVAFSLKARDGHGRAIATAMTWLFKQWGGITAQDEVNLSEVVKSEIRNSRDEVVGQIRLRPPG